MNKTKFYAVSIIQNFVLVIAFIIAGLIEAKNGISKDKADYKEYELLQSRKVFN